LVHLLENDAAVVAAESKAVAECHLDVMLLLLTRTHNLGVNTILGAGHVDGGVKPTCRQQQQQQRMSDC
jgi:hypothetical protein